MHRAVIPVGQWETALEAYIPNATVTSPFKTEAIDVYFSVF